MKYRNEVVKSLDTSTTQIQVWTAGSPMSLLTTREVFDDSAT